MLQKYLTKNITKPALIRVLMAIGELKAVSFETLKTVKNRDLNYIATRKMLSLFVTDNLLEITEFNNYKPSVKCFELFKEEKIHTKHLIKDYKDSGSAHADELRRFLLPLLWNKDHHALAYPAFEKHQLRPDACLLTNTPEGYQIRFIEVERTDKHEGYLIDKLRKYQSLGSDENTWSSWWKRWHELAGLPYCSREAFCFSVICKGRQTFEAEGWEWTT